MISTVRFSTNNQTEYDLAFAILLLRQGKPEVAKRILAGVKIT